MIKKTRNTLNLCYMLLHFAILVALLLLQALKVTYNFEIGTTAHQYLILTNVYGVVDFILNIFMFIIMFKASGNFDLPST